MAGKLRRWAIAAGTLFLFACVASLVQHADFIAQAFVAGIWSIVTALIPLMITLWILHLLLKLP